MFFNFDAMLFNVLSISHIKHSNGHFSVLPRPFSAISLRTKGIATFKFADTSETAFEVKQGNLTFFPANIGYEVDYIDSEIFVVHLTDCNYFAPENVILHNPDYITYIFKKFLSQWENGCAMNISKAAVYTLLSKTEEDAISNIDDRIKKCNFYMQGHFCEPTLKISDICKQGNISEASLYRQFMTCYGMAPKQYLLSLKLNYALDLLLQGNIPIQEIAYMSGFEDSKYFARIFKKRFGVSPSRYYGANQL